MHFGAGIRPVAPGVGPEQQGGRRLTRMPGLLFKLNLGRRHIPEQKHRVTNWRECDEGLRWRGSLTVRSPDDGAGQAGGSGDVGEDRHRYVGERGAVQGGHGFAKTGWVAEPESCCARHRHVL